MEVQFDKQKITSAIEKAFLEVQSLGIPTGDARKISRTIGSRLKARYKKRERAVNVEEIQDDVEIELMREGEYAVAKAYIRYRYKHEFNRVDSVLDSRALSLVDGVNEDVIQENSNKNPLVLSTQRDYLAGELSKDITSRLLLPDDIVRAHEEGIIHFHESIVA